MKNKSNTQEQYIHVPELTDGEVVVQDVTEELRSRGCYYMLGAREDREVRGKTAADAIYGREHEGLDEARDGENSAEIG